MYVIICTPAGSSTRPQWARPPSTAFCKGLREKGRCAFRTVTEQADLRAGQTFRTSFASAISFLVEEHAVNTLKIPGQFNYPVCQKCQKVTSSGRLIQAGENRTPAQGVKNGK
jgi:hypothetical protein